MKIAGNLLKFTKDGSRYSNCPPESTGPTCPTRYPLRSLLPREEIPGRPTDRPTDMTYALTGTMASICCCWAAAGSVHFFALSHRPPPLRSGGNRQLRGNACTALSHSIGGRRGSAMFLSSLAFANAKIMRSCILLYRYVKKLEGYRLRDPVL